MIAYPSILAYAAKKAGMAVPDDKNVDNFDKDNIKEQFPHFFVFCVAQLGRPCPYPGVHFDNAKIIAAIPESEIRTVTVKKLLDLGLAV